MLSIICALAENRAIGYNNDLLYHLRADLKRFKALTTGHTIIMGRRTFESLPKGALPNRRNIVLTRQSDYQAPGAEVFSCLQDALAAVHPLEGETEAQVFIIGGASVYAEGLKLATHLHLTHVHATPAEADVYFPEIDAAQWQLVSEEHHEADEQNEQSYTFSDYVRK